MSWSTLNAAELAKEHSSRIYFLFIDLAIDPFYGTTGNKTYTFDSEDWLGLGDIAGLGEFADAADVSARQLSLTLSGVDSYITTPLLSRTNYKNADVIIYRGFLDGDEDLIDDPDVVWKGRADVGSVTQDHGTASATLICEPAAARLLRPNVSRYADEDHQLRFSGDKYYEFLAEMQNKDVLWGGTRVTPGQSGTGGSADNGRFNNRPR